MLIYRVQHKSIGILNGITMAKKYRLLKDSASFLSIIPAGTEFEAVSQYEMPYCDKERRWWFAKEVVENNPDWFEEIKEGEDEIRRLNHQAELMAEEKDYWHNRCLLAEEVFEKCPIFYYPNQAVAYKKWDELKNKPHE